MVGFPNRPVFAPPSELGADRTANVQFVSRRAASLLRATATAVALFAGVAGAAAQTVPGPQWSGQNEVAGTKSDGSCCARIVNPVTGPGFYPNTLSSPLGGSVSSTVITTGDPFPSLSVSSQTSAASKQETLGANSSAALNYYIEVLGPEPTVTLDLLGSAALAAVGSDISTNSTIELILYGDTFTDVVAGVAYTQGSAYPIEGDEYGSGVQAGFDPASFQIETSLSVGTSSVIEVSMDATNSANSGAGESAAHASAYLDPYFFIDPNTPNADQYSIIVSKGIGNALTTPEPSTWAMILVGFAGIGFFARRAPRQKLAARA
jgi:hypothetical protein